MLTTVDQGIFQTQECNSTRLTRVLRLRKNQQWIIEGFTFSHWHQCTGFLLHQWPLKGACWGWAMSVSHIHWLWMPHIWASPVIKPLCKGPQEPHKGCQSTLQPWPWSASAHPGCCPTPTCSLSWRKGSTGVTTALGVRVGETSWQRYRVDLTITGFTHRLSWWTPFH